MFLEELQNAKGLATGEALSVSTARVEAETGTSTRDDASYLDIARACRSLCKLSSRRLVFGGRDRQL